MALKVFTDTNIIIDFIEQRPFDLAHVNKIFNSAEDNNIDIIVSESVITNALYITRLKNQIIKLLQIVTVVCIDTETCKNALRSTFKDKEDGILYYGAFKGKADYFIRRNKKDFLNFSLSQLPVISPKELMDKISIK
ncbi:MAG: PIN domain-containing protein [Ginsengibacter sp.]